jgi:RHS repeat-associated protein
VRRRRLAILQASSGTTRETRYLWCGKEICQARNGSDTVTRRYFAEGESHLDSGTGLIYMRDQLGSVRDTLNANTGAHVDTFDYDPYGDLTTTTTPTNAPDKLYAGMFYNSGNGLYMTRYRMYDSAIGRWLSRDPIREIGGINPYSYVFDDPISSADPEGLYTLVIDNGPTGLLSNPFGHSAIATTGSGVYSFGNNPNGANGNYMGTSLTDYLAAQAQRRDTTVFILDTTPDQERRIVDYLKSETSKVNKFPDNCTARVEGALAAGRVDLSDPFLLDASPIPFPASLERALAALTWTGNAWAISFPQYSTVPPGLSSFNPATATRH